LYKDEGILILKFTNKVFLREMTGAVRNGKPCLVEDIEETLDPAIDPILQQQ
jgi:dynein heavy chain, axonemal